jgi:hypothetical protein
MNLTFLRPARPLRPKKKPNISKIAREYGAPIATLRDRYKHGRQPRTAQKPVNKALEGYQTQRFGNWIGKKAWFSKARYSDNDQGRTFGR